MPFQLSCGRCDNCLHGLTNSCSAYPFAAAYGLPTSGTDFGGALADLMRVPFADHMLVALPDSVDPVHAASACDNVADGWRGVADHLKARPGASVLVVGGLPQSVGLYAAGSAVALGASRVRYLDNDAGRRSRATAMGAIAEALSLGEWRAPKEQFDIVVEAAGVPDALGFAIQSTAPNGVLPSVSMYFGAADARTADTRLSEGHHLAHGPCPFACGPARFAWLHGMRQAPSRTCDAQGAAVCRGRRCDDRCRTKTDLYALRTAGSSPREALPKKMPRGSLASSKQRTRLGVAVTCSCGPSVLVHPGITGSCGGCLVFRPVLGLRLSGPVLSNDNCNWRAARTTAPGRK